MHLLVGEHADDDDIGAVGDGPTRSVTGCAPNSLIGSRFSSVRPRRVHVVAGLDEALHHRGAHAARADEPDAHLVFAQRSSRGGPSTLSACPPP